MPMLSLLDEARKWIDIQYKVKDWQSVLPSEMDIGIPVIMVGSKILTFPNLFYGEIGYIIDKSIASIKIRWLNDKLNPEHSSWFHYSYFAPITEEDMAMGVLANL